MPPTVLFVDDDALLQEGMRRTLRGEPYRMLWAQSGEQALEVLDREHVDVLVADHQMPGIGGVELLAEMRTAHPHIGAIMLTGHASAASVIRALNDGQVSRILLKPCGAGEIASALRLVLAHKAFQDSQRLVIPLLRRLNAVIERLDERYPGIAEDHMGGLRAKDWSAAGAAAITAAARDLDDEIARAMRLLSGAPSP